MRRAVTFRTGRFESRVPKPHFINPNCFGEDLAAWLRPGLQAAGNEPGFSLWKRFTHRARPEDLARLCSAIDAKLRTEPEILEIAWWDDDPFRGTSRENP